MEIREIKQLDNGVQKKPYADHIYHWNIKVSYAKEDKELLLKDLCARLPYGVKIRIGNDDAKSPITEVLEVIGINVDKELAVNGWSFERIGIKPYLRPMSSMTEEEKEQIRDFWIDADVKTHATQLIDFYNKYHFDYRGLIEKGLVLEAPSEMY